MFFRRHSFTSSLKTHLSFCSYRGNLVMFQRQKEEHSNFKISLLQEENLREESQGVKCPVAFCFVYEFALLHFDSDNAPDTVDNLPTTVPALFNMPKCTEIAFSPSHICSCFQIKIKGAYDEIVHMKLKLCHLQIQQCMIIII